MTTVTVGLVADPGLPQIIVESVVDDLRQQLTNNATSQTTWTVQTSRETLPLNAEGEIPFRSLADRLEHEEHWDYFIYLTDLPRFTDGTPVLCEIGYTTNAAFISLPALGAAALKSKVQELILVLLHLMDENKPATNGDLSRKLSIGRIDFQSPEESGDVRYLTALGGLNRLRLLMGMVRSNRPDGW